MFLNTDINFFMSLIWLMPVDSNLLSVSYRCVKKVDSEFFPGNPCVKKEALSSKTTPY